MESNADEQTRHRGTFSDTAAEKGKNGDGGTDETVATTMAKSTEGNGGALLSFLQKLQPEITRNIVSFLPTQAALNLTQASKALPMDRISRANPQEVQIREYKYTAKSYYDSDWHVDTEVTHADRKFFLSQISNQSDYERYRWLDINIPAGVYLHSVRFRFNWKDQGWGNRKGTLWIRHERASDNLNHIINNKVGDVLAIGQALHDRQDVDLEILWPLDDSFRHHTGTITTTNNPPGTTLQFGQDTGMILVGDNGVQEDVIDSLTADFVSAGGPDCTIEEESVLSVSFLVGGGGGHSLHVEDFSVSVVVFKPLD